MRTAGVAAVGDRVVVITEVGPKGDFTTPQAHVSDDGGRHFTTVEMGPDTVEISSVVAAGETFVATGAVRTSGFLKPAAWSSAEGRSWSVDDIASLWEWDPNRWSSERADVWFSAPSYDPATDTVATALLNDSARAAAGATRDSGGAWRTVVYTDVLGFNVNGRAVQLGSRTSVLSTFSGGSAKESSWDVDSEEFQEVELVSYEVEPSSVVVADLGDQTGIAVATNAYLSDPDAWRITTTTDLYSYAPEDGLVQSDWAPAGMPSESRPVAATDPATGETMLMTHHWSAGQFLTRTWLRDESGAWTEGATIDAADVQVPTAVTHTEEGWLAALETEHGGTVGTAPRRAEIWVSSDGVAWTKQEGAFSLPDGRDSTVHAICGSALGPVAVGSMDDADGKARATAWRQVDGAWRPSVLADTTGSWLDACVGTEDGVMTFGTDGAGFGSWRSTDLSTFTRVDTLEEGLRRAEVVPVPGGYAAGGTARTENYVGPVLWLSPDAQTWTWVPLPVSTSGASSPVVAEVSGDLLVLHPALLRVWRVPDIDALLTPR